MKLHVRWVNLSKPAELCLPITALSASRRGGFGPPQPATWSYHAADCQPTAPVPLASLVQSAGTLYRTI